MMFNRIEGIVERLLARYVVLYRREYVTGIKYFTQQGWFCEHRVSDELRTYILGIRVPVEWALNLLIVTGRMPQPVEDEAVLRTPKRRVL